MIIAKAYRSLRYCLCLRGDKVGTIIRPAWGEYPRKPVNPAVLQSVTRVGLSIGKGRIRS